VPTWTEFYGVWLSSGTGDFGYRQGREIFFGLPKIRIGSGADSPSSVYRVGVGWEVLPRGLSAGIVHSRPSGTEICIRVYTSDQKETELFKQRANHHRERAAAAERT
jgi:hypothetical protein